ncbi:MAG TPA: dienelactone hydrolase family protein [Bacteroidia bacterium]|nr:dienelactone hydrolase family protein [Bacteroidia bacterium]
MKKFLFVGIIVLASIYRPVFSQSCCKMSATQQFGQLAMNEKFAAAHEAPLPLHLESLNGTMITYKCSDGTIAGAYEIKSRQASKNWLIVIHEWWGLNDYIRREAEKLQSDLGNVNVLAVDLYDGKNAETPGVAQELMGGLKEERARLILQGAITYAGPKAKIFTLGWCMGGGWSMQTALLADNQLGACVMYYGMPESDISKLKNLKGDVLGIFGTKDAWISPEVVSKFQQNMKTAGKKLTVKNYEADHAFANPSNPKHDSTATADAYKLSLDFLKSRMK